MTIRKTDQPQMELASVTYEQYCVALAAIQDPAMQVAGIFGDLKDKLMPVITELSTKFNLTLKDVIVAFQNTTLYKLFKSVAFNFGKLTKAVLDGVKLLRQGLDKIFAELAKSGMVEKLRKGVVKVDDILKQYPALRRLTGIAVAGLLLYVWMSMTFIGDLDFDFDITNIAEAFAGRFDLADLLTSANGLQMIALFCTGAALGISFPWLGSSVLNLIAAILYTTYKRTGKPKFAAKFAQVIKKG